MTRIFTLLLFIGSLYGQAPDTLFTRTFGDVGNDIAFEVHSTNDGGSVLAGYSNSINDGIARGYVVKTDLNGDEEWSGNVGEQDGWRGVFSTDFSLESLGCCCFGSRWSRWSQSK